MHPIGTTKIIGGVAASIDATFLVALATFVIAFLTLYATLARPRVRVYFWIPETSEITTERAVSTGNTVTLHVVFRNLGDPLGFYNRAATSLIAYIYFPIDWKILEARRPEGDRAKTDDVFRSSPSGQFANMKYIAVPSAYDPNPPSISIVSYKEDIICEVDVCVPSRATGKRSTLFCQITSREGDLGVHRLHAELGAATTDPDDLSGLKS